MKHTNLCSRVAELIDHEIEERVQRWTASTQEAHKAARRQFVTKLEVLLIELFCPFDK